MKNTESSLIVVQWNEVDDSLPTNYTVIWTSDGTNSTQSHTLIEQSSFIITGLTLDTVYTITITAANMCGTGPEYSTSVLLTTGASSTTSITPTATDAIPTMLATSTENHYTMTTITSFNCATTSTTVIIPSTTTTNSMITPADTTSITICTAITTKIIESCMPTTTIFGHTADTTSKFIRTNLTS